MGPGGICADSFDVTAATSSVGVLSCTASVKSSLDEAMLVISTGVDTGNCSSCMRVVWGISRGAPPSTVVSWLTMPDAMVNIKGPCKGS